jgi:hypothetical protein
MRTHVPELKASGDFKSSGNVHSGVADVHNPIRHDEFALNAVRITLR